MRENSLMNRLLELSPSVKKRAEEKEAIWNQFAKNPMSMTVGGCAVIENLVYMQLLITTSSLGRHDRDTEAKFYVLSNTPEDVWGNRVGGHMVVWGGSNVLSCNIAYRTLTGGNLCYLLAIVRGKCCGPNKTTLTATRREDVSRMTFYFSFNYKI
jgi:hypothetical protein